MFEITPDGTKVRDFLISDPAGVASGGFVNLTDVRDVYYHGGEDAVYVTHIGHTGFSHRIMKFDFASGQLMAQAERGYVDHIVPLADGSLLVGSRTNPPAIFDPDLTSIDPLAGDPRLFVAAFPAVFHPFPAQASAFELLVTRGGSDLNLHWESRFGFKYVVEQSGDLLNWSGVTKAIDGTGATLTHAAPLTSGGMNYRIRSIEN